GVWGEGGRGAGGPFPPPQGHFEKVQEVLRRYDILFVADEVICGFARTGEMWGCQTFGIRPDMLTSAKALSAAMLPISAVLINVKGNPASRCKWVRPLPLIDQTIDSEGCKLLSVCLFEQAQGFFHVVGMLPQRFRVPLAPFGSKEITSVNVNGAGQA